MTAKHSRKLEQLKREIDGSGLDVQHKAYANDVLDEVAETTNGTPDKLQATTEAILCMTGYMVRRDIFLQEAHSNQIEDLGKVIVRRIEDHTKECPLLKEWGGEERRKIRSAFISNAAAAVIALKPIVWPVVFLIAVALFAPVAPQLVDILRGMVVN